MSRYKNPHDDRVRINVEFSAKMYETLTRMVKQTDEETMIAVLRKSVRVYDKLLDMESKGQVLYTKDELGQFKEILIL